MKPLEAKQMWENAEFTHEIQLPYVTSAQRPWGKVYGVKNAKCEVLLADRSGFCRQIAGSATIHYGAGKCGRHRGNTPRGNTEGFMVMAIAYARRFNISPAQALLDEVHRSAGAVNFLEQLLSEVQTPEELLTTHAGWVAMYERERAFGVKVNSAAIAAGAMGLLDDQNYVYASSVANLINSTLGDLELTPIQEARARELVAARMRAIGGDVEVSGEYDHDVDMSTEIV